jgi:hypothetical protein
MINSSLLTGVAKCLGALMLSVVVLWQTADNAGLAESEVSIHVASSDVDVWVDEEAFRINRAFKEVIVCRLRPGWHELRMTRDGELLYEEAFTVERGHDVVLTAWEATSTSKPFPCLPKAHKL